jgi:ribosomal protein S27E
MKELKFVKIRCRKCENMILIPTFGKFIINIPLSCNECGKTVAIKNN